MPHVSIDLMCMRLHRLHKWPTYAHPVFTKAFEMWYPVLKEMYSPYAQLLQWQHTLYVSLNFIRTICAFDCITSWKQFDSIVRTCKILKI